MLFHVVCIVVKAYSCGSPAAAGGHLDYWWCDAPFQLRMFRDMLASAKPAAATA